MRERERAVFPLRGWESQRRRVRMGESRMGESRLVESRWESQGWKSQGWESQGGRVHFLKSLLKKIVKFAEIC